MNAKKLYDAHREATLAFTGEQLPHWNWLDWQERIEWEDRTVEQAERDRPMIGQLCLV